MRQPDLFAAPPRSTERAPPNLTFIRKALGRYLNLLRDAEILPWAEHEAHSLTQRFPALAAMLPDGEGAPLVDEFFTHLDRLGFRRAA